MRFEPGSFDPDHYELFFSLSLDMFSIGGIDGNLKHVNSAWAKTLGIQPNELKARPIFDRVHPDDLESSIECAEKLKAGEEITNFQNRIRCSDGSYRDFLWSCKKHPHLDLIYSVTRDVTEFKEMQSRLRISEKMASLGTLAAGVAHEVNNPLSFVMGHIHFLKEELKKITGEEFLNRRLEIADKMKIAEGGLERIRKIVKSLKLFSRDHEEKIRPVPVEDCLRSAAQFAENEIKYRAQLVMDIQGAIPPVLADEGQLVQVVLNLLVNAAQAIPAGAADQNQITIRCEKDHHDVLISVTDTGSGIPPEILNRVFEPFFTSKPVGEGTGLGLSICHGIIASFKGEITVESFSGIGTTFKVRLPAALSLADRNIETGMPTGDEGTESFAGKTVLIIDDEESLAEVVAMMLEPEYHTVTAFSVKEALDLIPSCRPDLILCDLMMPHQTGMDLFRHLEAQDPELAKRIIFMTGGVFANEAKEFLGRTEAPTLEKPFAGDRLKAFVHSIFLKSKKRSATA